ncbi:MAG: Unknown protein [uncultured Sulfurovum sp.]|uniref:Uncharacterized protein n=1 Tax=uncultured Sulfurovum sp. TaxID=269237 RepID=A0A6S6TXC3_9BACT|nr:MAG: Unknown protein [uncultured Sulfurovum sp.]
MVQIKLNQALLDKHILKIVPKIKVNIAAIGREGLSDETVNCLNHLDNEKEIQNLLSANSFQLKLYIAFFQDKYPTSIGMANQKKEDWNELYKILRENIFEQEYKNWGTRTTYGAYAFVETLGLKSCPYCNRNYTFTVNNKNGKLRPEIDHFYPKSVYPFLAMSFYNLIPSCQICNHTKSSKVKENLENPYDMKEGSYRFTYIPNSIDFTAIENEKYNFANFEIDINGNEGNIKLFKLEELYRQHKDVVLELLIKKVYYPESYIKELEGFGFAKDEIYRYLFSNYNQEEDFHKRPLSKLIKDISEELGLT